MRTSPRTWRWRCACSGRDSASVTRFARASIPKGPPTLPKLITQRVRWTTGFLRNIAFDYRDLIGGKKNEVLGLFVLPLGIIAIGGGIFVFALTLIELVQRVMHTFSVAQAAPLSYAFTFTPHAFSCSTCPSPWSRSLARHSP